MHPGPHPDRHVDSRATLPVGAPGGVRPVIHQPLCRHLARCQCRWHNLQRQTQRQLFSGRAGGRALAAQRAHQQAGRQAGAQNTWQACSSMLISGRFQVLDGAARTFPRYQASNRAMEARSAAAHKLARNYATLQSFNTRLVPLSMSGASQAARPTSNCSMKLFLSSQAASNRLACLVCCSIIGGCLDCARGRRRVPVSSVPADSCRQA